MRGTIQYNCRSINEKNRLIMKKIVNIILIACCILITGCGEDDGVSSALKIIKADINVKAAGGEAGIELQSVLPVKVTVDAEWCKVTEQTASLVKFSVEANTDFPGRSTLVTISDGVEKQILTLVQEGAIFIYNESEQVQRINNKGGSLPVELYGSFPCETTIPEADKGWLSYVPREDGKGGSFIVSENTTGAMRGTVVKVTCGSRTYSYAVMQYEATDLLGIYRGQYISLLDQQTYGLSNVIISGPDASGFYTIDGLLEGETGCAVKAVYENNMFSVSAGQKLKTYDRNPTFDIYFGLMNLSARPYWTPEYTVGLVPVFVEGAGMGLSFQDNGGMPNTYAALCFSLFAGDMYYQDYEILLRCLLYRPS